MICYLNIGFILEQALVDVVKRYLDRQQFDKVYSNFHISVVNEHPFAHMIVDDTATASDNFPAIVITTQTDSKPSDLINMQKQVHGIGLTSKELDEFVSSTKRNKTKINSEGEVETVKKNGVVQTESIPGYVFVIDDERLKKLKDVADSRSTKTEDGMVYGIRVDERRRDRISVEIWADNNQLKNELYEHLRLLFTTTLEETMKELYSFFDPSIFGNSVNGERSSNYNFDFDCILYGSHITFEMDYNVSQIVLDTEINNINYDLITEVINHVKN